MGRVALLTAICFTLTFNGTNLREENIIECIQVLHNTMSKILPDFTRLTPSVPLTHELLSAAEINANNFIVLFIYLFFCKHKNDCI